jgi:hypothetical protein
MEMEMETARRELPRSGISISISVSITCSLVSSPLAPTFCHPPTHRQNVIPPPSSVMVALFLLNAHLGF